MTMYQGGVVDEPRSDEAIVLRVNDLVVEFPAAGGGTVHAVSGVSFELRVGETLGIVGESGCGKSTTGQAIMGLVKPKSGSVSLNGGELVGLKRRRLRRARARMQLIFQDPISSLNPRRRIRAIVGEGLSIWGLAAGAEARQRVDDVLREVGLDPDVVGDRRPAEMSGGQCQRVSIARALVMEPKVLICDEPVSALDVSIQAQILNLLADMKSRHKLSMLFIAHDLGVVRHISDRVVVMYLGRICEIAPWDEIFERPRHPYTKLLLDAIPTAGPDPNPVRRDGTGVTEMPSPLDPPSGCRFRTRCPRAETRCSKEEPRLRSIGDDHHIACHFPLPVSTYSALPGKGTG